MIFEIIDLEEEKKELISGCKMGEDITYIMELKELL